MRTLPLFYLYLFFIQWSLSAQETLDSIEQKKYHTSKINNSTPTIDGQLNDVAWQSVDWGGDFIQQEPYEGKSPTQKTAFKMIYDIVVLIQNQEILFVECLDEMVLKTIG